uniref:K-box domain-containing protein n=1 Tax=Leersia perrieri TaxID=77586 RepID=A0A0D9XA54_9ORYZ
MVARWRLAGDDKDLRTRVGMALIQCLAVYANHMYLLCLRLTIFFCWTACNFSVLESEINGLNIAELRNLEKGMTNALTVVKDKLRLKVAGVFPKSEHQIKPAKCSLADHRLN